MKKKGFTLVELLAVIVILAIIALIATPIILNVIETAKKGAIESSAIGYLDAVEKQIAIDLVNNGETTITNGTHEISELSNIKVKGEKPTKGWIKIKDGKIAYYSLYIGNYTVSKTIKGEETVQGENISDLKYICKRATTLHTEECTQTSSSYYCSGAGYTTSGSKGTSTITYGSLGTSGTLTSGDAFDCDVNGDGTYDANTERFYYISDLTSNSNYAVLIYYNDTKAGVADNTANSFIAYDESNENWHGPLTAIENLPTTTQWSNVNLASTTRAIANESGGTTTSGGTLPTAFDYSNHAARLLTYQEVATACGGDGNPTSSGELDTCNYLMENTEYSSSSIKTVAYWLETPLTSYSSLAFFVSGGRRNLDNYHVHDASRYGVRPTIEVLKSNILY